MMKPTLVLFLISSISNVLASVVPPGYPPMGSWNGKGLNTTTPLNATSTVPVTSSTSTTSLLSSTVQETASTTSTHTVESAVVSTSTESTVESKRAARIEATANPLPSGLPTGTLPTVLPSTLPSTEPTFFPTFSTGSPAATPSPKSKGIKRFKCKRKKGMSQSKPKSSSQTKPIPVAKPPPTPPKAQPTLRPPAPAPSGSLVMDFPRFIQACQAISPTFSFTTFLKNVVNSSVSFPISAEQITTSLKNAGLIRLSQSQAGLLLGTLGPSLSQQQVLNAMSDLVKEIKARKANVDQVAKDLSQLQIQKPK